MPETVVDYYDSGLIEAGGICCKVSSECPYHGGEGYAFFRNLQELLEFLEETIQQELSVASEVKLDTVDSLLAGAREYLSEFGEDDLEDSEFSDKTEPLLKLYGLIKAGSNGPGDLRVDPEEAVGLFNDFFSEHGEEIQLELRTIEEILEEVDLDESVRGMKKLQRLLDEGEFDANDISHLKLAKKAIPRPSWE